MQFTLYHGEPEVGIASQNQKELEARLQKAPVVQNLVLQLAGDDDPTDVRLRRGLTITCGYTRGGLK